MARLVFFLIAGYLCGSVAYGLAVIAHWVAYSAVIVSKFAQWILDRRQP